MGQENPRPSWTLTWQGDGAGTATRVIILSLSRCGSKPEVSRLVASSGTELESDFSAFLDRLQRWGRT